ncbi:hypothetical protein BCR44DRAFT_339096 [Catenaria anguillulae PL171]|uniref:Uncharacterized protein n=1 Tax=Catenaria anguillulae PL171 TaxID=765915 RepID=A0A1Y2H5I1_9FUNG|nr:hypothetical protein BCR44DRAFT_339096 [Catenaria anguillulae PL171]
MYQCYTSSDDSALYLHHSHHGPLHICTTVPPFQNAAVPGKVCRAKLDQPQFQSQPHLTTAASGNMNGAARAHCSSAKYEHGSVVKRSKMWSQLSITVSKSASRNTTQPRSKSRTSTLSEHSSAKQSRSATRIAIPYLTANLIDRRKHDSTPRSTAQTRAAPSPPLI